MEKINKLDKIISTKSDTSSKRFISIMSLFLFAGVVVAALFGIYIPDSYVWGLITMVTGNQALTLFQKRSYSDFDENNNSG